MDLHQDIWYDDGVHFLHYNVLLATPARKSTQPNKRRREMKISCGGAMFKMQNGKKNRALLFDFLSRSACNDGEKREHV